MKKLILLFLILFVTPANATECMGPTITLRENGKYHVTPDPLMLSIVNDIFMVDLRWRMRTVRFVERTEPRAANSTDLYHYVSAYLGDQKIYQSKGHSRWASIYKIRGDLIGDYHTTVYTKVLPVVPRLIKATMDFTCLPIGFMIFSPEDGLIEQRWDGQSWFRPNQLSQRDFAHGIPEATQ